MMVNETNDKFSVSSSAVVDAFVENMDNDDTFSSSEYKQPFVRCFTVSRLEIKYSSENSSCRIKWAAYSHTRGHTPTLPYSAQVYLARIQYLPPPRSHWEKSIRLSLHGLFAPGLSAYPSYCYSNLVAKTRIANITNVMLHKQSNIFMMKTPSSKSAMFSV